MFDQLYWLLYILDQRVTGSILGASKFFFALFCKFYPLWYQGGANFGCQRNISLKLYTERQINVTSDFLSLLVFSNELVPSKNVKNTRSLRSLDVLLHFKALTDVRALKFHTCTQNIGLKPPFTGSYLFQELDPDGSRFLKGGTTP